MSSCLVLVNSRGGTVQNTTYRNRVTINLFEPIRVPDGFDAFISVSDAQIPNSYYNINDFNKTVSFNVVQSGAGTVSTVTLTIPIGNYSLAQLVSALNGKALPTTVGLATNTILTLTCVATTTTGYAAQTNLNIGFSSSAGVVTNYSITGFTSPVFGFNNQTIVNTGTIGALSPVLLPKYYIIASTLISASQAPGLANKVLPIGKVPATVAYGYYESFRQMIDFDQKIGDRFITQFDVFVLDDNGNDISFNGTDWSCTLQFNIRKTQRFPQSV